MRTELPGLAGERRSRVIVSEYQHFLQYILFAERQQILSPLSFREATLFFFFFVPLTSSSLFRSFHEAYNEILSRLEA